MVRDSFERDVRARCEHRERRRGAHEHPFAKTMKRLLHSSSSRMLAMMMTTRRNTRRGRWKSSRARGRCTRARSRCRGACVVVVARLRFAFLSLSSLSLRARYDCKAIQKHFFYRGRCEVKNRIKSRRARIPFEAGKPDACPRH